MSSVRAKRVAVSLQAPWLLAALVCLGCAMTPRVPPGGLRPARIEVGASGGAQVLAMQHTASDCGGYTAAATDREELDALWSDFALPGSAPDVDFGADVVVAWGQRQGCYHCLSELVAVEVSRDARLLPQVVRLDCTSDVAREGRFASVAIVVALPRASLPRAGFIVDALELPERARGSRPEYGRARDTHVHLDAARERPRPIEAREPEFSFEGQSRGTVELPPCGEVAPGRLLDGERVWVVHHADGGFRVLAADMPMRADPRVVGLRRVTTWSREVRRFLGESAWDEYGTSIFGRSVPPLDRFEARPARDLSSRVEVGARRPGIPRAYTASRPLLDARGDRVDTLTESLHSCEGVWGRDWGRGLASPYDDEPARSAVYVLRHTRGEVALVSDDLVSAGDDVPRLCRYRERSPCPPGSPTVHGLSMLTRPAELRVAHGPFAVRVRDGEIADLVALSWWRGRIESAALDRAPSARRYREAREHGWSTRRQSGGPPYWEAGGGIGFGAGTAGAFVVAARLHAGARWYFLDPPWYRRAEGELGDDVFETVIGDTCGLDLRLRWFALLGEGQRLGYGAALGVAPVFVNAVGHGALRVPSLLGAVLPEFGVMFRSTTSPRPYVGFSLPFARVTRREVYMDAVVTALVLEGDTPDAALQTYLDFSIGMGFR